MIAPPTSKASSRGYTCTARGVYGVLLYASVCTALDCAACTLGIDVYVHFKMSTAGWTGLTTAIAFELCACRQSSFVRHAYVIAQRSTITEYKSKYQELA